MKSSASTASGRSLLVQWAKGQDDWIRDLTNRVLQTNQDLSEQDVAAVYQLLLVEKQLAKGEHTPGPTLSDSGTTSAPPPPLTIASIDNVKRVNALAPGQTINFNPKMTVLFGPNGSGKTGYVRILRRLSSVRREEPILPDILADSPTTEPPEATITYKLGDEEHPLAWRGEASVPPFTRLDSFDAADARAYVDDDLTYVYTPADIALFRFVSGGLERVRKQLETAKKERSTTANPFLSHFPREVSFFPVIDGLGATTDMSGLRALASVTTEEEASVAALTETVAALSGQSLDAQVQAAQADYTLFNEARILAEQLRSFDIDAYNQSVTALAARLIQQTEATQTAFAADPLPGFLSSEWRAFIEAGDSYLKSLGLEDYPTDEELCLYCRQPLSAAAMGLLRRYREFNNDEYDGHVRTARQELDGIRSPFLQTNASTLEPLLQQRKTALAGQALPSGLAEAENLLAPARALEGVLKDGKLVPDRTVPSGISEVRARLEESAQKIGERLTGLRGKAGEREKLLKENTTKLIQLQSRIKLRELLSEIENYVERAKWAKRADEILRRLRPVSKALTDASKLASERLLNQDFEKHFRDECKLLRTPHVVLDFHGQRGQPARRKVLRSEYKLSQTLSEGEQKVIALADFLAEAALRTSNAPVVFDDPVNSLDYSRVQEVATRLAALAEDRQVIVFTHNIWFTAELLERFRDHREDCAYYDVRIVESQRGIVSGGTHPRTDSVGDLTKRIKRVIAEAKKTSGEVQDALIFRGYSLLRALSEVIVESEFFEGVVRRYEPNLMLTLLPKVKPQGLKAAGEQLYPIYKRCCRFIDSHSQPREHLNIVRTIDELEEDFSSILEARTLYKKAAA